MNQSLAYVYTKESFWYVEEIQKYTNTHNNIVGSTGFGNCGMGVLPLEACRIRIIKCKIILRNFSNLITDSKQPRLKKMKISKRVLEPNNILRIEAQSNYCKIYFIDRCKTVVVAKVLHLVQQKLPADMFVRVHKSHLINKQHIRHVSGTNQKIAELTNGECIPISRRKQAVV